MVSIGGDIETGGVTGDGSVLCLAVVRETTSDVVVFDAKGDPRAFSYKGTQGKVCFSGHGHNADDFLTPCFDEDGNHGDPEETCFCGIETSHLHAHIHDPSTCDVEESGCQKKNRKADDALMKLAKLTLHPSEESLSPQDGETVPLLHMPISEQLPNECNGHEFSSTEENSTRKSGRRLHRVQHDDHVDFLVLNDTTGELHLEHPHEDCGKDDVHGKFNCIGKRKLVGAASGSDVNVHFFEAAPKKFNVLDYIKEYFEADSGLVAAIRPVETINNTKACCSGGTCSSKASEAVPSPPPCCSGGTCSGGASSKEKEPTSHHDHGHSHGHGHSHDHGHSHNHGGGCCSSGKCTATSFMPPELLDPLPDNPNSKTVRSTIVCTQICCSSEIPGINKIMETLDGVSKTMINVPLKQVTVDHDHTVITAKDIENALNKGRFGATIKRDGGAALVQTAGVGRSHFHVAKICCASEIPAINKILEPIEGVSNIAINVTTKLVYVDHDTGVVSAQALCDALNDAAFGATLKKDAGATVKGAVPAYVTSTIHFENDGPDAETLKQLLDGYKASQMESFVMDAPNKPVILVHNPLLLPVADIVANIEQETGKKAIIKTNGADSVEWDFPTIQQAAGQEAEGSEDHKYPKPTVMLSGIFWIVSMMSFMGGNWEYLKYVALLSVAFGIPGIAIKAITTMRRFMFDTNCLMLFAAVGAVALQEYTEAAAVTFLFAISEWLEMRATTRARNALSAIVNLRPEYAFIVHPATGEQMMVPASSVPVGATVAVKTGDRIPCDGVVLEGNSAVDESSLTGESRPVKKGPKDIVSGGTINCGASHLMVQTTSTADNSAISRLVSLVEEAQANRSETEKIVDEFAKIYTPIVVLAALMMCTIPWAFGAETGKQWMHNGLVLIVVACPCALIISTPVTYVAGLAATAQRGVLIKGGAHLEALGLTKTICFDKTGTLTQGSFALIAINHIGTAYTRQEVLEYLVMMEERANHPLALAIVDGSRNEGIVSPKHKRVQDHTFMAGEGLSGKIDGKEIYVGNARLFQRLGLLNTLSEEMENTIHNWEAMAGTVGFMSIEGAGIVCAYCVADAVRPESVEVVEAFIKLGIDVHMLTGDNKDAAKAIGNLVGLPPSGINSELKPEEKLKFITDFKGGSTRRSILSNPFSRRELVCHVGDGVNDAPALAAADIGVAMGVGAALAMETADVTLLDSNLRKLLYSVNMGRRVIWKIKENVAFSLIVKFIVLGFTVAGKVALWAAIVSDVGAMICVTLNGMRLLPSSKIDREKMGDIENVTYHSQVSEVSHHERELPVGIVGIEIGTKDRVLGGDKDYSSKETQHTCGGHAHAHHSHSHHEEDKPHSNSVPDAQRGHTCGGHSHAHHSHSHHAEDMAHPESLDDAEKGHTCGGHSHAHHSHSHHDKPQSKEAQEGRGHSHSPHVHEHEAEDTHGKGHSHSHEHKVTESHGEGHSHSHEHKVMDFHGEGHSHSHGHKAEKGQGEGDSHSHGHKVKESLGEDHSHSHEHIAHEAHGKSHPQEDDAHVEDNAHSQEDKAREVNGEGHSHSHEHEVNHDHEAHDTHGENDVHSHKENAEEVHGEGHSHEHKAHEAHGGGHSHSHEHKAKEEHRDGHSCSSQAHSHNHEHAHSHGDDHH